VIAVVCLNPAIDVTFFVDELAPGMSHRVGQSRERAGGKGLNVARVLRQLDVPVVVVGFVGGRRGAVVRSELDDAALPHRLVDVAGETRRSVTVVDPVSGATVFNEPGPRITGAEWERLVRSSHRTRASSIRRRRGAYVRSSTSRSST
jgi:tagatose 6-phosphate kinase